MINASVSEALLGLRQNNGDVKVNSARFDPEIKIAENIGLTSFPLTFIGFGNSEMAMRLGEIIKTIVREIGYGAATHSLDGITFALNYPTALAGLDRGDKDIQVIASQPRDYGRPVAKVVQVLREGVPKSHIVIDADIAYWMLSDNDDNRAFATHLLLTMLAELVHTTYYEAQLKRSSSVPPDEIGKMLFSSVSTVPSSYFCAKLSAFADPNAGERYATLVKDSLATASEAIKSARLAYRTNNDMRALLNVALPRISFVLTHVAEWLGHREGLSAHNSFPGSSLPNELELFELHRWLELFDRDLRNLYSVEGQFSPEQIFALSSHVERLLWTVQICPWPTEDGSPFVSVPYGNDLTILDANL